MSENLHLAMASAMGAAHVNVGNPGKTNNQDAMAVKKYEHGFVVVLCDGCGSQPRSEIGADIGAHLIAGVVRDHLSRNLKLSELTWEEITNECSALVKKEVEKYQEDETDQAFEKAVNERFLFTAMVLAVRKDFAAIASFGDGIFVIDEEVIDVKPPIPNTPPYMGYLLLKNTIYHDDEFKDSLCFSLVKTFQLSKLKKGVVVATDGLRHLIGHDLHHPSLVQPGSLQTWLNIMTAEKISKDSFKMSDVRDDVTVAIVRTVKAQKTLFENRSSVALLQREIVQLVHNVNEFSDELARGLMTKAKAKADILPLEVKLEEIIKKSLGLESFLDKVAALESQLKELNEDIPSKAYSPRPVATTIVYTGVYEEARQRIAGFIKRHQVASSVSQSPVHRHSTSKAGGIVDTKGSVIHKPGTSVSKGVGDHNFPTLHEDDEIEDWEPPSFVKQFFQKVTGGTKFDQPAKRKKNGLKNKRGRGPR